ncbi:MAG: diaminopimelate dehydrogenase [Methanomicrobiales archaeon]|jgi:diaminopimelate dehydrogenase|nr:diaminopimelate dehydrogenase [Methanomicrobiales archaeon]
MQQKIRIGIVGYGNVGKGAEKAVLQNQDMELIAIFSRRALKDTESGVPAVDIVKIAEYKDKIDVMLLCGGSATDLPEQGPEIAKIFHTVDSFDTHANIPKYYQSVDEAAKSSGKLAAISVGWDPGLFSLHRLLGSSILPQGKSYTFWGKGVSQGHSDAIRHIEGVKYAIQYTNPREECMHAVRAGENPVLRSENSHWRECYVVAEKGADITTIEQQIKTMPNYFAEYETQVHFISEEEFHTNHAEMPHGGFVFRSGETSKGKKHVLEFALKLDKNPEFTAFVLATYARAVFRMAKEGKSGAVTVFDIPFGLLSPEEPAELRSKLL